VLLTGFTASGAVVYQSHTAVSAFGEPVRFDLDGDGGFDVEIDFSVDARASHDGAFVLTGLPTATIVAENGITLSFSDRQFVDLSMVPSIAPGTGVLTGGYISDPLGNPIVEGWGGVKEYDDLGFPIIPPGAPTHQIDLFLVALPNGAAWVDLDISSIGIGWLTASWGYDSPVGDTFTIAKVPEPSAAVLSSLGALAILCIRRRRFTAHP